MPNDNRPILNVDLLSGNARLLPYLELDKGDIRFAVRIKDDEVTVDATKA